MSPRPLRVALTAVGSEGDVAPVIAIGSRLAERGHEVGVVVLDEFAHLVEAAGLRPQPISGGAASMWPDVPALRWVALAQPGLMYATMLVTFRRLAPRTNSALLLAAEGADVIVTGLTTRGAGGALAAATGAAHATVLSAPLLPASERAATALGQPVLTHATSRAMWAMTRGLSAAHTSDMTRRVGHSPRPGQLLVATSPVVSPSAPEWPADATQVGWIRSTAGRSPMPDEVRRFLDADAPPVVMTFGSCPVVSPERDRALFVEAARRAGVRLILPDGGPPVAGDDVLATGPVDFAELLPRVGAIVHHGGAGTTYTALAAGAPAVVVPHLGDQGYYARRVAELGAGPRGIPRWRLTARALADRVRQALDGRSASGARAVASRLAGEDGAAVVADRVERLASAP